MDAHALTSSTNPTNLESNRSSASAKDMSIELADTVVTIVKEVGQILSSVPYVQSLSGVILQIIKVRDEIKTNKKRCKEIIDKVLRMSKSIYEKLAEVGQSNQREKLSQLEGHLREHERILMGVYLSLDKHRSRPRFLRLINRGLEELNEHDRRLDELNTQLILAIVFHITMEQVASAPPSSQLASPDSPSSVPDHTLPPKPYLMVDRDTQLNIALNILLSEAPGRIAILGGGGFGKTTLARTILHDPKIVQHYQSRYFLPCEGMSDADSLLLGLGTMLSLKMASSSILSSVRRILESSTTIICFDNFETPWEPSSTRTQVEELLETVANIPNLSLIITMRGEQRPTKVAWSRPLLAPLSTLSLDGAKSVLQNIAGDHISDNFSVQLLQEIDGIPLAVTLVSTLLRDGQSSESLWRRWSTNHTQILDTGGDDRHSNLNRSISLSVYSLRMEKDSLGSRQLLAALSLLPDGFPADGDALENLQKHLNLDADTVFRKLRIAVKQATLLRGIWKSANGAADKKREVSDIHTAVQTLRTVALVGVDETGISPRIQMLSPIRLFCHQFLSTEVALALEKIVDFYINLLSDSGDDLTNSKCYMKIVPEVKNIHSIFKKAFTAIDPRSLNIPKLVAATIHLTEWSWYIGYYARDTLEMALAKATRIPSLHAHCLVSIGDLYQKEAEPENAEKYFREAAKLFKQRNNPMEEANALQYLGNVLYVMRQLDEAEEIFKESLEIYTKADDKGGQASGCFRLGELYADKEQYLEAETNLMVALEAYKQVPDLLGQANAAQNLSRLHIALGNVVKAENFATESLTTAKQAKYALGEGNALRLLGHIYRLTDKMMDARRTLEQALTIQKEQNNPIGQLNVISDLGQVYIQSDQLSAAEKLLTSSVEVELNVIQMPDILTTLGWVYICGDQLTKAEQVLDKALALFQKFEDKSWQADVLAHLGNIYLRSNRLDDAERVLQSIPALGVSEDIKMRRFWVLGDLYAVKGQLEDAEGSYKSAMDSAKWCHSSYQQGNIFRSMGILHIQQGRVELAIKDLKEAIELHRMAQWVSEQATDLMQIGKAYSMLKKSEEARAAFGEAERLMEATRAARTLL